MSVTLILCILCHAILQDCQYRLTQGAMVQMEKIATNFGAAREQFKKRTRLTDILNRFNNITEGLKRRNFPFFSDPSQPRVFWHM